MKSDEERRAELARLHQRNPATEVTEHERLAVEHPEIAERFARIERLIWEIESDDRS